MIAMGIVLGFPLLLLFGYGIAFALVRDAERLASWPGLLLYIALLMVPLTAVLIDEPGLFASCFVWSSYSPAWLAAGVVVGLALIGIRRLMARGESGRANIWTGPPGLAGFLLLMLPVAVIVVAEEVVWRGFLQARIGLWLASAAFALHHYHFGVRHVVFTFGAGLAWGALRWGEEGLYGATVSHLTYNAAAWVWMRRSERESLLSKTRGRSSSR